VPLEGDKAQKWGGNTHRSYGWAGNKKNGPMHGNPRGFREEDGGNGLFSEKKMQSRLRPKMKIRGNRMGPKTKPTSKINGAHNRGRWGVSKEGLGNPSKIGGSEKQKTGKESTGEKIMGKYYEGRGRK